jgi:SAM-dependent methyltransferase
MLALARRRLGDDVALHLVDLNDRLPFDEGTFDDVVGSLVLHYLQDWGPTLTEFRRVLKPGGRLIVSVNHPTAEYSIARLSGHRPDYFETYASPAEWPVGDQTINVTFWNRPLHAMTDAFTAAGFRISVLSEPQPAPEARELFPDDFFLLATAPSFLFFVLEAC